VVPGFIVRNAADAGSALDLAEPDALDFNLLGNRRYGVLSGCDLALSGWNLTMTQGVVMVNDLLVATGGQVTLPTSSQQPRFDLIAVDQGGTVTYIRGTASPNPVFPDYSGSVTIMAAVYITPGQNPPDPVRDLTDKRRFLPQRFLSNATSGDLLASYAASPGLSAVFTVSTAGRTEWLSDTRMYRSAAKTLTIEDNVTVAKVLTADSAAVAKTMTVGGDLSAANLLNGQGPPGATPGTPGDLYQDQQNGGLWSYEGGGWLRLSTVPIPPGFIMASLATAVADGWLLLDGRTVDKPTSGGLWNAFPEWRLDANTLRLPNATGAFLRMAVPQTVGGLATAAIQVANMPPHTHIDKDSGGAVTTSSNGAHTHTGTIGPGGDHGHSTDPSQGSHHHDINDPNHWHEGADGGAGGSFVAAMWGGTRRLDGPFNDASHPVSVGLVANTKPSPSHVTVNDGGTHQHFTNIVPPHGHPIDIDPYNSAHVHGIPERSIGGGQAISIIPPFLGVQYLIKT
jgi:hypothetical protein